jgi:hypothetical protein
MTAKSAPAAAPEKSASELLIEQIAAEKLRESVNPLSITDVAAVEEKTDDGVLIVERKTFANGAVLENYA